LSLNLAIWTKKINEDLVLGGKALTTGHFHSHGQGFYGHLPFCFPTQHLGFYWAHSEPCKIAYISSKPVQFNTLFSQLQRRRIQLGCLLRRWYEIFGSVSVSITRNESDTPTIAASQQVPHFLRFFDFPPGEIFTEAPGDDLAFVAFSEAAGECFALLELLDDAAVLEDTPVLEDSTVSDLVIDEGRVLADEGDDLAAADFCSSFAFSSAVVAVHRTNGPFRWCTVHVMSNYYPTSIRWRRRPSILQLIITL